MLAKMAEASQCWKEVRTSIAMEHKERLQEFGLNPLEIQHPGDPWDGTGSQPLPPYQHTWRASHIHCPTPQLPQARQEKVGPVWPWDALLSHSALHNITHMNSSVDLSFNHTPNG